MSPLFSGQEDYEHPRICALMTAFSDQLKEFRETLREIVQNPNKPHPTYVEMYFNLATDTQGPRAALEAELTRRGRDRDIRHISVHGLRQMYLAWRDYCEEVGHVRDDREIEGIVDDFKGRFGLPRFEEDDE
jgi:hypothetical protein